MNSPEDMQPTTMASIRSTPASARASRAVSVKIVRSDLSQSSPHFVMPTPMIATSLIAASYSAFRILRRNFAYAPYSR